MCPHPACRILKATVVKQVVERRGDEEWVVSGFVELDRVIGELGWIFP